MDNQKDYWTRGLKMFNVCWISKFKEENERIFIHGQWPMAITSIRLTETWTNFSTFFAALSKFDAALNGGLGEAVKGFNGKAAEIISFLFAENKSIPAYIEDTFKMFRFSKKTLHINLEYVVVDYPAVLQDLIVESSYSVGEDKDNVSYKEIIGGRNLLKSSLINLFPNLNHIIIQCTQWNGECSYQFSLCGLLDILSETRKTNKIKCSLYGILEDKKEEEGGDRK
eukprot:UN11549